MNVADSNSVEAAFLRRGFLLARTPECADLIIVNTCSVREHAEQRAKARITEFCRIRKPGAGIWVIGCMAERLGEELRREIPGIDRVVGARSIDRIEEFIDLEYSGCTVEPAEQAWNKGVCDFVTVIRGCDNYCAYCIVPYVRGHEQSISKETIIDEIGRKAERGVKEITLLGQNVNSYIDNGMDFADLLAEAAQVNGIERIRFTTSHPKDCSEKLIRTIASEPKCCHHIHLPFQAGSDAILRSMKRGYTSGHYRERIAMIRSYLPDADITTDIMVGFPGETDKMFDDTLALVDEVRFTTAFMFAYSVREGTVAAKLTDTVSHADKQARLRRLIDLQTAVTKEIYAGMRGRTVELLISGRQEKRQKMWMGLDRGCKRALIACDDMQAGTILQADVLETSGMTLICKRTHQ